MPKHFKTHIKERDWAGAAVEVLFTIFLLFLDAAQIFVLFAIAKGLENLLEYLHIKSITISTYPPIHATQIIENFDYMLLVMFLVAVVVRFGKLFVLSILAFR